MSSVCVAALYTPATWYHVFSARTVVLLRCTHVLPGPVMPIAKRCGPVSGLVLNCQPSTSCDLPTMIPSSRGSAAAFTHALHVALPVSCSALGFPTPT